MDLLLDINVAVDICTQRQPYYDDANLAMAKCLFEGGRIWLYAGSVQTLEYVTRAELKVLYQNTGQQVTARQMEIKARAVLKEFAVDKHWLASLSDECSVFDSIDPEDEQLIRALSRFATGTIKLLTRDDQLRERYPKLTITPQQYLQTPLQQKLTDFIDLKTQQDHIRPVLENNIQRILHHGQYVMGPEIKQLEERLAEYVGVKHCISVSSGTDTLLIALMALGIGYGDEVITTPFTFIATGEMIALLGAIPVFVDIDPFTYNIDAAKIEAAISTKTKAIMPVSLYGQCADFDVINAVAQKHGLPVIEDAAQSFGATYKGKKSCALSTIGSTSFFPSKPLGGYGDSGALFTDDDTLAKAMREIRVHGQDRRYHHPVIGINGRMDTLQAAILLAKLEIFPAEVAARSTLGKRYTELLQGCVTTPHIEPYNVSVYAQYTIQVNNRVRVQQLLNEKGIPTAVHYPVPLHLQPAFAQLNQGAGSFPVAERVSGRVLSIPMHPYLSEEAMLLVTKVLQAGVD